MVLPIVLLILAIVLLLAILLLLLNLRSEMQGTGTGGTGGGGTGATIPNQIPGTALAAWLGPRLAGTPLSGSTSVSTPQTVVWVDSGGEVLVHLDSLATQIVDQTVLVSIDLECDQTGRTPLVVALSLGQDAQGGLVAATDQFPRGNGALAARWGAILQAAVWNAFLSLANDHATERGMSPVAVVIRSGNLQLETGPALKIA